MDNNNVISNSEQKILDAAKKVFLQKGMYGARMQEIAEEAGINKALLHYYFRSKKKLFLAIFKSEFMNFGPRLFEIFSNEHPLQDKVSHIVGTYIDILSQNPYLPAFIVSEIQQNPDLLADLSQVLRKIGSSRIIEQLREGIEKGDYIDIKPEQFFTNLLAWCIFPFLSKPIVSRIFLIDESSYPDYINERRTLIPEMFMNSLKKS